MSTLPDSLIASTSRPVAMRMRGDLVVRRHRYQGEPYYVVKEPIGQQYSYMRQEDFAILQSLDGMSSLQQLKQRFEERFAPLKISYRDLQQFLATLHRSRLVVAGAPDQGRELLARDQRAFRNRVLAQLSYIFAIRTRGIDPEPLLNVLAPLTGWLFSRTVVVINIALWLAALTLVVVQFDVFLGRLPAFHEFFGPANWIYMGMTLAAVKILHEFGHGLTCKRFGGECHELGFMLLVFMPALYCNVSDSWLLSNKYKRIAIASAGIYVELTLAALATFVWWFTVPGMINFIALNVMFICSVNTVVFNGNPLLRFDGYYILAHFVEIPNLRQKSRDVLKRRFCEVCLGLEMPEDPYLPRHNRLFMAVYSVTAVVYRWLVLLSILLFVNASLEPYGLQIVGRLIALTGFFGLIVRPAWQIIQFCRVPGRIREVKLPRVIASGLVLAAVVSGVMLIPLPRHVKCSAVIELADGASVYVVQPGRIEKILVEPGKHVTSGEEIVQLANPSLQFQVIQLRRKRDALKKRLSTINKVQFHDHVAALEKLPRREELDSIENLLRQREEEFLRLTIRAPQSGVIVPASFRRRSVGEVEQLPSWSGYPLDRGNLGAHLEEGLELCRIGDPVRVEAILLVDQTEVEFVEVGQPVRVQLESQPSEVLTGTIGEISQRQLEEAPGSVVQKSGGDVATRGGEAGRETPLSTTYQARVVLDEVDQSLSIGQRGRARITVESQTLGVRLWRALMQSMRFQ